MEFQPFEKMARLTRECVITEKIDGTNAQIYIVPGVEMSSHDPIALAYDAVLDLFMFAGSRSRWITPEADNFGFAKWVKEHAAELWTLGPGRHFGEWWGQGIQRGYGLTEKRFSLFNVARWHRAGDAPYETIPGDPRLPAKYSTAAPACCDVVPVLYRGEFTTEEAGTQIERLKTLGSVASVGYMSPEGIVVFHVAAGIGFKKTIEKDEQPKSKVA